MMQNSYFQILKDGNDQSRIDYYEGPYYILTKSK